MKIIFFSLIFFSLVNFCTSSEIEEIELGDITITATKTEEEISYLPLSVSIIKDDVIGLLSAQDDISDIIRLKEGIDIQRLSSYTNLSHSFVKLRGLVATKRPTSPLTLIDGIPINRGIDGMVNFAFIPIESIERIEIIRGPFSSLYGSYAMGGVINIITKKGELIKTKLNTEFGNHNYNSFSIIRGFKNKDLNYYITLQQKDTENYLSDNKEKNRDYTEQKLMLKVNKNLFTTSIVYSHTEGGLGISSNLNLNEEIQKKVHYINSQYKNNNYNINLSTHISKEKFFTEDFINFRWIPTLKRTTIIDTNFNLFKNFELNKNNKIIVGIENILNEAKWNITDINTHTIISDKKKKINNFATYSELLSHKDRLTILTGVRYDYHSQHGKELSPKWGVNYRMNNDTNIYFNYGYAFRAPTLLELYAHNFAMGRIILQGNKDLEPEKTYSYEFGIKHKNIKINYFRNNVKDLITLIPLARLNFTLDNVNKAIINGVETEINYKLNKYLNLFSNYTYSYAIDKDKKETLEYSPYNKINTGLIFNKKNYKVALFTHYVDNQYYKEIVMGKEVRKKLSDYFILNTNMNINLNKNLKLNLSIKNLTNKKYQEYASYSAPRRTFIIGLTNDF